MNNKNNLQSIKKLHLTLVIDEENTEKIDINQNEDINHICKSICVKYNITEKIKQKLLDKITQHISTIENELNKNKTVQKPKKELLVNRLYTKGMQNMKKKEIRREELKKAESDKLLKLTPFSPKICAKSQEYCIHRKSFSKFEDKLYYDDVNSRQQKQLKNLMKNLKNNSERECKQFVYIQNKKKFKNKINLNLNKPSEEPQLVAQTSANVFIPNKEKITISFNTSQDEQNINNNPELQKKNTISAINMMQSSSSEGHPKSFCKSAADSYVEIYKNKSPAGVNGLSIIVNNSFGNIRQRARALSVNKRTSQEERKSLAEIKENVDSTGLYERDSLIPEPTDFGVIMLKRSPTNKIMPPGTNSKQKNYKGVSPLPIKKEFEIEIGNKKIDKSPKSFNKHINSPTSLSTKNSHSTSPIHSGLISHKHSKSYKKLKQINDEMPEVYQKLTKIDSKTIKRN